MNRLLKLISILLIQAFLVLDIAQAANGKLCSNADSFLAPTVQIDNAYIRQVFTSFSQDKREDLASRSRREFLSLFIPALAEKKSESKEQGNSIAQLRIKYKAFDEDCFFQNEQAVQVVKSISDFILKYKKLVRKDEETIARPKTEAFTELKNNLVKKILELSGTDFKALLPEAIAQDQEALWRKLMFELVPEYLAGYGVILHSEFIPIWKKGKLAPMIVGNFELYQVKDVVPFSLDKQDGSVTMDELLIIPVETEDKEVMSLEIYPAIGKVIHGNVAVCMSRVEENAQDFIDQLNQTSWEFVKNAQEIPWDKYLLLGNKEHLTPLTFCQVKILSRVKNHYFTKQDIINWMRSRNRYQQGLIAEDKSGVALWNGSRVNDLQARESAGLKVEARLDAMLYCDEEFIDIEMLHLISVPESTEILPEETVAKITILNNMIDYIERHIAEFPDIRISPLSYIEPRAQIAGQFFTLDYEQIIRIAEQAYNIQREDRKRLSFFYDIKEFFESKNFSNWAKKNKKLVSSSTALVVLGAMGIFGWLTARKLAVQRVMTIVLTQVLNERLNQDFREKITDEEIYTLAKILARNEFKARIALQKLFKHKKFKPNLVPSPKVLLKETLNRVDDLSENKDVRRNLIINDFKKKFAEFILKIEKSRKPPTEKKAVTHKKKKSKPSVKELSKKQEIPVVVLQKPEVSVIAAPKENTIPVASPIVHNTQDDNPEKVRVEFRLRKDQEVKGQKLERLLVDNVYSQLESRKQEIDPEAYRTLLEAVNDLRAEVKIFSVRGKEYPKIRRQVTSLGEAVREEPALPKAKQNKDNLPGDSQKQENGANEPVVGAGEDKTEAEREVFEAKNKYLLEAGQVIAELEGQIRLLKEIISLEDELVPLEAGNVERFPISIQATLKMSNGNGRFDAYSRILMYLGNDESFVLKISHGIGSDKLTLVPAGTATQKIRFLEITPEKLRTARFFLQYNAMSEKIQVQALEEIKKELEKSKQTGVEVLDYILRLNAPVKSNVAEFSQEAVNDLMLNNSIGLLHGGVGTAKTTVLLGAAEKIALERKKPVLIFAPQHVIADEITLRTGSKGIPVLRCGNSPDRFKKEIQENYSRHSKKAKKEFERRFSALNIQPNENGCILTATVMGGALDGLISMLDDPQSRVYLRDVTLVIDEAALINYPELIAAVYLLKPKALFLIGDHIQYKPFSLISKFNTSQRIKFRQEGGKYLRSSIARYEKSIFEQLINNPLYAQMSIIKNFRNHWIIVELVQKWYAGYFKLESLSKEKNDPFEEDTLEIADTSLWKDTAFEKQDPVTGSYSNTGEALWILGKIKEFLTKKNKDGNPYTVKDITIITPYRSQIELIKSFIEYDPEFTHEEIEFLKENVVTSQQIQGGENKITLVSLVRSNEADIYKKKNEKSGNGTLVNGRTRQFLFDEETIIANPALLLVSLTRAKEKTAVIGNRKTLEALTLDSKSGFARQMYALIFDFGINLKKRIEILKQNEFSVRKDADIETIDAIAQSI
ncbi:MAG: AAA family ATPase [Candidatus Omnitrophica bacterium]|nr:AAA family ATPase [Candidatus Omnitrophota bacterium]